MRKKKWTIRRVVALILTFGISEVMGTLPCDCKNGLIRTDI